MSRATAWYFMPFGTCCAESGCPTRTSPRRRVRRCFIGKGGEWLRLLRFDDLIGRSEMRIRSGKEEIIYPCGEAGHIHLTVPLGCIQRALINQDAVGIV